MAERSFQTLAAAVDWIAGCIEANAPLELAAAFAYTRSPQHARQADPQHFAKWVFPVLQARHRATGLRALYAGRSFPQEGRHLTLGGHDAELGHLHIDFSRTREGWVLDEIWMCR